MLRLLFVIPLLAPLGCLNIEASPDVRADLTRPSDPAVQYTPYGRQLEDVLDQQTTIADELKKRDWEELSEELGEWRSKVRNLNSVAHTSENPERLRSYCDRLLSLIGEMQTGARHGAAETVRVALDAADPVLDDLSGDFRITEPAR